MKVNLGSGKNYLEGYVNIDINPMWKPDIVCDIGAYTIIDESNSDITFRNSGWGDGPMYSVFPASAGRVDEILANDVLEHIPDLVSAMTNCLALLRIGGTMDISVPYYLALGAWQDPTHVRAFNENSWIYYTDWFWYLGWKDYRFEVVNIEYVLSQKGDHIRNTSENIVLSDLLDMPKAVDSMHVTLRKVKLTDDEKKAAEAYHGVHR